MALTLMSARLSAIICTYQRYHVLAGAIESLLAQSLAPGEMEIIVVDNSPDQAAAAAYGARYSHVPHLRYVLEPVPGLSNARNTGIRLSIAPIAGFIDDDAVADPGWAAAILAAFAAFGPNAGAVGGPVRPRWRSNRPDWLDESLWPYLSVIDRGGALREIRHRDAINGCNMALDRQLAIELGGFTPKLGRLGDETILLSNEEPALFIRMHEAGRATVYAPAAIVEHLINPARLTQNWFRKRAAWQAVSDYIMAPMETAALVPEAKRYLQEVEKSQRRQSGIGFFGPVSGARAFADEVQLIRNLTIATLSGGAEMAASDPVGNFSAISPKNQTSLPATWWKRWLRQVLGVRPSAGL